MRAGTSCRRALGRGPAPRAESRPFGIDPSRLRASLAPACEEIARLRDIRPDGKYARLRQELEQAYGEPVSSATRNGLIDRLASELLTLERRIALLQAAPPDATADVDVPSDRRAA